MRIPIISRLMEIKEYQAKVEATMCVYLEIIAMKLYNKKSQKEMIKFMEKRGYKTK